MSARKLARNGKLASTPSASNSVRRPTLKIAELRQLLASIYNQFQRLDDPATNKACRLDFIFHMTDWSDNLRCLADLYKNPKRFSKTDAREIVASFLYHATAHVMEAARLMLDYEPGYIFDSPKPKKANLKVRAAR